MNLAGVHRLTRSLLPTSHLSSITNNSTQNRATIIFLCDQPVCAGCAGRSVRFTGLRYVASAAAFSRRPFIFQPRPLYL